MSMKSDFLANYYVHGKVSEGAFDNEFYHMAFRQKLRELLEKGEIGECIELLDSTFLLHDGERRQGEPIVLVGKRL